MYKFDRYAIMRDFVKDSYILNADKYVHYRLRMRNALCLCRKFEILIRLIHVWYLWISKRFRFMPKDNYFVKIQKEEYIILISLIPGCTQMCDKYILVSGTSSPDGSWTTNVPEAGQY